MKVEGLCKLLSFIEWNYPPDILRRCVKKAKSLGLNTSSLWEEGHHHVLHPKLKELVPILGIKDLDYISGVYLLDYMPLKSIYYCFLLSFPRVARQLLCSNCGEPLSSRKFCFTCLEYEPSESKISDESTFCAEELSSSSSNIVFELIDRVFMSLTSKSSGEKFFACHQILLSLDERQIRGSHVMSFLENLECALHSNIQFLNDKNHPEKQDYQRIRNTLCFLYIVHQLCKKDSMLRMKCQKALCYSNWKDIPNFSNKLLPLTASFPDMSPFLYRGRVLELNISTYFGASAKDFPLDDFLFQGPRKKSRTASYSSSGSSFSRSEGNNSANLMSHSLDHTPDSKKISGGGNNNGSNVAYQSDAQKQIEIIDLVDDDVDDDDYVDVEDKNNDDSIKKNDSEVCLVETIEILEGNQCTNIPCNRTKREDMKPTKRPLSKSPSHSDCRALWERNADHWNCYFEFLDQIDWIDMTKELQKSFLHLNADFLLEYILNRKTSSTSSHSSKRGTNGDHFKSELVFCGQCGRKVSVIEKSQKKETCVLQCPICQFTDPEFHFQGVDWGGLASCWKESAIIMELMMNSHGSRNRWKKEVQVYFGRNYRLSRTKLFRRLSSARMKYSTLVLLGESSFKLQCFFIAELIGVFSSWGEHALDPELFHEEFITILQSLPDLLKLEDGELIGELLLCLSILQFDSVQHSQYVPCINLCLELLESQCLTLWQSESTFFSEFSMERNNTVTKLDSDLCVLHTKALILGLLGTQPKEASVTTPRILRY